VGGVERDLGEGIAIAGQNLGEEQRICPRTVRETGEMDQGILRFTWHSLVLVAKGYALALLIGTPLGFFLGLSKTFTKTFDPIIQILRPVSPLAWLPLGLVLFLSAGKQASELGALFTIAICAMWPTVLNTAVACAPSRRIT
jgi:nitrate/nitrite transport system permease protein